MSAVDTFYKNLERSVGLRIEFEYPGGVSPPTRARLCGVSVGELAQALRFSGLSIFTGRDGVIEVRRVDSQQQETK
jgi:hypothetical protein